MEENNTDAPEVLETPETVEEQNDNPQEETLTPEDIAELKKKAAQADELEKKNKQLYERVKKSEGKPVDSNLSPKDYIALTQSGITAEDFDEVMDFAKYKNVSVAEALAHSTLKSILDGKAEERRTASATQTRSARGSAPQTGESLLSKAETTGEVPTTAEGMKAITEARMARRKAGN